MKNFILKLLYVTAYHMGVFRVFFYLQKKRQTIVTYHNVIGDDLFDSELLHLGVSCRESSFVKQLDIIKSEFKVITEVGIPGSCIVSFDDGYKNNIEIAARLLNDRKISGLFFVPACSFESRSILWADELLMWVSYVPTGKYTILGGQFTLDQTNESRRSLWTHIYETLLSNYVVLDSLRGELDRQYSFDELKTIIDKTMHRLRFEGMNPSELEAIKKMGHGLGCHSFKHDILSALSDDQLEDDFTKCESYSQKYNTRLYSYPFGGKSEVSPKVISACKKHHYSAAFLNYLPDREEALSIGRISLDDLNDKYFITARLCGFERFVKKMLRMNVWLSQ